MDGGIGRWVRAARVLAPVLLTLAGCSGGGDDSPLQIKAEDVSGQYTYAIQSAQSTCNTTPASSGTGAIRITQASGLATICAQGSGCNGEHCSNGTVTGATFVQRTVNTYTEAACSYDCDMTHTAEKQTDGSIVEIYHHSHSYESGDCTGIPLPCETSQVTLLTPCDAACYDELCTARAGAAGGSYPFGPVAPHSVNWP